MDSSLQMVHKVLEKTLGYSLERIEINQDGTTTHLHSMEFLEKHPERIDSPEFTEEEEDDQIKFIATLAKLL